MDLPKETGKDVSLPNENKDASLPNESETDECQGMTYYEEKTYPVSKLLKKHGDFSVFMYDCYYPAGGYNDFCGCGDTVIGIMNIVDKNKDLIKFNHVQIVNVYSNKIVCAGERVKEDYRWVYKQDS